MTRHASQERASGSDAPRRLLDLAARRLSCARVMQDLSTREPALLAAVDAASRGELEHSAVEEVLAMHLAARESCLENMRAGDGEWARGAEEIGAFTNADRDAIQITANELTSILEAIQVTDAVFAQELAQRRRAAGVEIGRTDSSRAANRAYAPITPAPRFTDRRV